MKVFWIDKYNTMNKFIKSFGIDNVERKENCRFRMTKNDFVVISDMDDFDGLDKLKNIIFLVKNKEYKCVWKLVSNYKTLDVIDINMPVDYIVKRINRLVCEDV